MDTKAVIQFGDLSMNLEGSEAFVSAQIERFADLIVKHGSEFSPPQDIPEMKTAARDAAEARPDAKPKKVRSSMGAGAGCAAKVKGLLDDGFFSAGRSTGDIESKLREQATPYSKSKISAVVIRLAQNKTLRRYQEGGEWLYMVP